MEKIECLKKELNYIKNEKYRKNAEILINLLPDYFFEVPASSTGKYHPNFALGQGGLVRHTKVAVRIAYDLLNNPTIGDIFKDEEKDLMLTGLILHDGLKSGLQKSQYTLFDHPLLISNYIKENKDKLTLTDNEVLFLTNVIESHMGPWNTNNYSDVVLPTPKNKYQKFVHMCDYLASRKFLDVKFVDDEIVG